MLLLNEMRHRDNDIKQRAALPAYQYHPYSINTSNQEMSGVEAGVDRIVDQIVNPAAMEAEVESVIYR